MVIAEIVTLVLYAISIVFLPEYFGACFQPSNKSSQSLSIRPGSCRPFVRHLCALRLEGGRDCGGQRFPIVCDQVH